MYWTLDMALSFADEYNAAFLSHTAIKQNMENMKLAIEILKKEISQRELAQKYNHLRKDEVQLELESLNKVLSSITNNFSTLDECENEAITFTNNKMKVVGGLLSEDYKIGYKEGIEHYLANKNGC
jgi:hypothetical protein